MQPKELDKAIASAAVLLIGDLRARVREIAKKLGPDDTGAVLERLTLPALTAEEAGMNPMFAFEWPWKWMGTVIELLGCMGTAGASSLWSLLENPNPAIPQRAIMVLLRMPAKAKDDERDALISELKQRLPKFHRADVSLTPIVNSLIIESRKEPEQLNTLSELSELVLLDVKKKKFVLGDLARDIMHPPAPPPKPPELPEHFDLAEKFADAILSRNFDVVRDMLAPPLRKKMTAKKLEAEFTEACSHSGWPVRHEELYFSGKRADELRGPKSPFQPSLPKRIKDEDFRNWISTRFWPPEDVELFAFDLWVAIVASEGELKIGYYWTTAED